VSTTVDDRRIFGLRLGAVKQFAQLNPKSQGWCRSALPWATDIGHIPRRPDPAHRGKSRHPADGLTFPVLTSTSKRKLKTVGSATGTFRFAIYVRNRTHRHRLSKRSTEPDFNRHPEKPTVIDRAWEAGRFTTFKIKQPKIILGGSHALTQRNDARVRTASIGNANL
jgi:hypothetical protein